MKDPRDMTADELGDWLAEDEGWRRITSGRHFARDTKGHWYGYDASDANPIWEKSEKQSFHPIGCGLDAAAGAMPKNWTWLKHAWDSRVVWHGVRCGGAWLKDGITVPVTNDEERDRLLLAVLCRISQKSTKEGGGA